MTTGTTARSTNVSLQHQLQEQQRAVPTFLCSTNYRNNSVQYQRFSAALTTGTTACSTAALTIGTTPCSAVPTFLCSTDCRNNTFFLHTVRDCTNSSQKQYSPPSLAPSFRGCYTHSKHPSTPPHAFFLFIVNVPAPPTLSRPQK